MTYKRAHLKNERVSRVNQFGQNSTIVYRERLFRLDPEYSGSRSQLLDLELVVTKTIFTP